MPKTPSGRVAAIGVALDKAVVKAEFKSGLEEKIAEQLTAAGIEFDYEGLTVPYVVPAREAKYKADFPILKTKIIIEGKGHFGGSAIGRYNNMKANSAQERQKFALLKEQHPDLDIRFVFSRAAAPIYKGSPTTHAAWAETHGFKWADKTVPPEWIEELRQQQAPQGQERKRKKK